MNDQIYTTFYWGMRNYNDGENTYIHNDLMDAMFKKLEPDEMMLIMTLFYLDNTKEISYEMISDKMGNDIDIHDVHRIIIKLHEKGVLNTDDGDMFMCMDVLDVPHLWDLVHLIKR